LKPTLTVVVEGNADAVILKHLLAAEDMHLRFFAANGRLSLASVARNILIHDAGNVMVVGDADTHDDDRVREDRATIRLALRHVAPEQNFDVFLFLPELEAIFFEVPSVLRASGVAQATPQREPKRALQALIGGREIRQWAAALTPESWADLRQGPQASQFLQKARDLAARPSMASH
jgi:hypothetical protein